MGYMLVQGYNVQICSWLGDVGSDISPCLSSKYVTGWDVWLCLETDQDQPQFFSGLPSLSPMRSYQVGPKSTAIYLGKFHHDLTVTSLEIMVYFREIIPKWLYFSLVKYYNLPRYMVILLDYYGGLLFLMGKLTINHSQMAATIQVSEIL